MTTDPTPLQERIARALYARINGFPGMWERLTPEFQQEYLDDATAVLPIVAAEVRKAKAEAWRMAAIRSAPLLEAAWDEGNAMGLDGWIGPERGEEPDAHAIQRRERTIDRLADELAARATEYETGASDEHR